jgi:hypothetical protein
MLTIEGLRAVDRYKMVFEPFVCFVAGGTAVKWTCMSFCIASHDGEERVGVGWFVFPLRNKY